MAGLSRHLRGQRPAHEGGPAAQHAARSQQEQADVAADQRGVGQHRGQRDIARQIGQHGHGEGGAAARGQHLHRTLQPAGG
jgi:hypothetical protein